MKYSKEIVEKISGYIRLGMRNDDAARLAGINETTFYDWKRSKPQFSQSLKEAEDEGEASNLAIIQKAKTKHWPAAAWLLERRHPDKYSSRREITGPKGGAIPVRASTSIDLSKMDEKKLEALAAKLDALLRPKPKKD